MSGTLPHYDAARLKAVCERLELRLVVLFGSRAAGSRPPASDSDLDLALRAGPAGVPGGLLACYDELSQVFQGETLDLVLLAKADPLLRYEVMRAGILLHGDSGEFLEYRAYAYRDFVDSADLRDLEATLFRKKLEYLRSVVDGAA
ncbi:MAG: nucleotidyltransferase domain-containing protein [Gemmatimonadetes bacterium]|nr:nucleotidyltransferase domain-containing protein [Gemmatimonadota bacterium]